MRGHQEITREWWEKRRDTFQLYISQLVVDEVSAGDPVAARERLKALQDLPLLDITPEVTELATGILASGRFLGKAATDAAHIANAAVHGMDFLVNLELRAYCECGDYQGARHHLPGAPV